MSKLIAIIRLFWAEKQKLSLLAAMSALLLVLSVAELWYSSSHYALKDTAHKITQKLKAQEADMRALLDRIGLLDSLISNQYTPQQFNEVVAKSYNLLIYNRNDQLVFWNSNEAIPPVRWYENYRPSTSYIDMVNATYQVYIKKFDGSKGELQGATVVALFPVKYQYKQENRYLANKPNKLLGVTDKVVFFTKEEKGAIPVGIESTNYPLFMQFDKQNLHGYINWKVVILQIASMLLLLVFMQNMANYVANRYSKKVGAALFYGCILLIVGVGLIFNLPSTLMNYVAPNSGTVTNHLPVFTVSLTVIALLIWLVQFTYNILIDVNVVAFAKLSPPAKLGVYAALLMLLFAHAFATNYVLRLLITQYDANINLAYLISPEISAWVAVLCGLGLYYVLYRCIQVFVALVRQLNLQKWQYFIGLIAVSLAYWAIFIFVPFYSEYWLTFIAIAGFVAVIGFFPTKFQPKLETRLVKIGWLMLLTLFASFSVYLQSKDKEQNMRRQFAYTLREDKQFETDFEKEANNIINEDEVIKNYFLRGPLLPASELVRRIESKYLRKYKSKYNIKSITPFSCSGKAFDARNNPISLSYYEELLYANSINTNTNYLYLIPNDYGGYYYLAKVPVFYSANCPVPGFIIIELEPQTSRSESIYPELISKNSNNFNRQSSGYSFAIYQNGILENFKGTYVYELEQPNYLLPPSTSSGLSKKQNSNTTALQNYANLPENADLPSHLENYKGFSHLLLWMPSYSNSDSLRTIKVLPPKTIVVSAPNTNFTDFIGLFTFIFALAIFTLLLKGLFNISAAFGKGNNPLKQFIYGNLEGRISTGMMAVLFITMIPLIALPTYIYYQNSATRYTENLLNKQKEVLSALNAMIDQRSNELHLREQLANESPVFNRTGNFLDTLYVDYYNYESDIYSSKFNILTDTLELNSILNKVAKTFDIDINIYDLSGDNIASSSPEVFEKELKSRKINPIALTKLTIEKQNQFIHTESIGKLSYLAAYIPIKDETSREIKAFLNLPYYARQRDFAREFSDFLLANSYLYLFLFIAGTLWAYYLSQKIIEPLKLIGGKLKNIKLGQKNERIQWQHNDEIGVLINQYNQAIEELEKSAQILAESERQSAWKQIARQVIHELLNPLTPIKTRMELLQTALKDDHPQLKYHIGKSTEVVLEQIEVLEGIISNFKEFNEMPKARLEYFDLLKLIQNEALLFAQGNKVNYQLEVNMPTTPCLVLADKNQTVRVFNNLLKNAAEALVDEPNGLILVEATLQNNQVLVSITDNGHGIPQEIQTKIFQASFTTKPKGSGIGLAMSRQIIQSFNGKLYFTSEEGISTTFFVELPLANRFELVQQNLPEQPEEVS
ncbi:MAG TPA: HAMP domain-containing sensor histidine kinase [Chitinophagales bacterium]|mgnify:FL=1|nr:HAMP domain-containing sensor histidine kinase [Chitinophagales bacterium]